MGCLVESFFNAFKLQVSSWCILFGGHVRFRVLFTNATNGDIFLNNPVRLDVGQRRLRLETRFSMYVHVGKMASGLKRKKRRMRIVHFVNFLGRRYRVSWPMALLCWATWEHIYWTIPHISQPFSPLCNLDFKTDRICTLSTPISYFIRRWALWWKSCIFFSIFM